MAFTRHGHHIKGTPFGERPANLPLMRCGGPQMCGQCAKDAAAIQIPGISEDALPSEPSGVRLENKDLEILNKQRKCVHPCCGEQDMKLIITKDTMSKVFLAFWKGGIGYRTTVDVVDKMLDAGILFREEKR